MTSGGVEVTAGAIEAAVGPLAAAEKAAEDYGDAVSRAVLVAAGGAGEGPLAGVLDTFADDAKKRAKGRGEECRELSQALVKTLDSFRGNEAAQAQAFRPPSFGGVTG